MESDPRLQATKARRAARRLAQDLSAGPFPATDGWGWLYRAFQRIAPVGRSLRYVVCRYFWPARLERWRRGKIYRLLGVHLFGAIIPTGGILVRRVLGVRMAPYTLSERSLRGARAFYYRACVFEALHLPFFLALTALAIHRLSIGRLDLALQNMGLNLLINCYPMLHHRRTRVRIVKLLLAHAARRRADP